MAKRILIPIPRIGFDPSEAAISWNCLADEAFQITFTTPDGQPGAADPRMLKGLNLGIWKTLLRANADAVSAYNKMEMSQEFNHPIPWKNARTENFDGLLLPGGHAAGMKEYLESTILQKLVVDFFDKKKPVAAICHGVVLAARSKRPDGKSVLYGHKTTALLKSQELTAWGMTAMWLGSYYRTYPETVEDEVKSTLASPDDFLPGPPPLFRDSLDNLSRGFAVTSGNYISARWPGDTHTFARTFMELF